MRTFLQRLNQLEAPLCRSANQRGEVLETQQFFQVISRLGDGVFWYVLIAMLPVWFGEQGVFVALHMLLVGGLSLTLYKLLKISTLRDRPCDYLADIHRHGPVLDRYSFPSGHTMHAVGFTAVILGYFPMLGIILTPFVFLVASSRLILGLHYPSDVIAGALIGATIAWASFQWLG